MQKLAKRPPSGPLYGVIRSSLAPLTALAALAAGVSASAQRSSSLAPGTHSSSNIPLATIGSGELLAGGTLIYVDEPSHGADRNGDGDLHDSVLAFFDRRSRSVTNLGQAGKRRLSHDPRFALVALDEAQQALDHNGDGDQVDLVFAIYRSGDSSLLNLALADASSASVLTEGFAYLAVSEFRQGASLNGDGDLLDEVIFVHSTASGETENLGLGTIVGGKLAADGPHAAFLVAESAQGVDLNGNDSKTDHVVHVYDADTGITRNLGLAAEAVFPFALSVDDELLLFLADERQQGIDLDGDGDALDLVPHTYDFETQVVFNSGLPTSAPGDRGAVSGDAALFPIAEETVGDLNGDGDTQDDVAFLHRRGQAAAENLGVPLPFQFLAQGGRFAFGVSEAGQGSSLNDDHDLDDTILFLVDGSSGALDNTGIELHGSLLALGPRFVFLRTRENLAALDLNGDGDLNDEVLFAFDSVDRELRSSGRAMAFTSGAMVAGDRALLVVPEIFEGRDLNGDGDLSDSVLHTFLPRLDRTLNLRREGGATAFRGSRAHVYRVEAALGRDLNGDGDQLDAALSELQFFR